MTTFRSEIELRGAAKLPRYSGARVMMMPFLLEDPQRTVHLRQYRDLLRALGDMGAPEKGVAYLTIDEAMVEVGQTHRRPGLHVDGVGPGGDPGPWASKQGKWAGEGMLVVANRLGSRGWVGEFEGAPGPNGCCAHLADQCVKKEPLPLLAESVYWCGPTAVHEALPMTRATFRQFVRVSFPNDAPWYEGYTRSPFGIEPTGPVHPRREAEMAFRSSL